MPVHVRVVIQVRLNDEVVRLVGELVDADRSDIARVVVVQRWIGIVRVECVHGDPVAVLLLIVVGDTDAREIRVLKGVGDWKELEPVDER